jgi:hypothetical protein
MDRKGMSHFWLDILAVRQQDAEVAAEMRVVHEAGAALIKDYLR